jgi:hypothetical protein
MSPRYRVCEYAEDGETRIGLCEVVTDDNGMTKCVAVASTEVFVSLDEMKRALERMRHACDLPVLRITDDDGLSESFEESIELADELDRRFDT